MIVEWWLDLAYGASGFFMGLIPATPAQMITVSFDNMVGPWVVGLASLSPWVPWWAIVAVFPTVTLLYLLSMFVRFARAVLGHIPMIGGNG